MIPGANPDSYELMVLTESPTKALWVDDIRFELVKVDHAKADAVYADIAAKVASLRRRVEDLENQARADAKLAANPYLRLGTAVAQRFIDFAQNGGPDGRSGLAWSQLQLEEVAQVLDETESLVRSGRMALLDWQPPKPGPVKLKNGTWYEGRSRITSTATGTSAASSPICRTFLPWARRSFRMAPPVRAR